MHSSPSSTRGYPGTIPGTHLAGDTREQGKDKHIHRHTEKLGLSDRSCSSSEAQCVCYVQLDKKVGLLHSHKQRVRRCGIKLD